MVFEPPPYPYHQLQELRALADAHPGGVVDLSIGTPVDPPPEVVVRALATSGAERGYPSSLGSPAYREAAAGWLARRFGVEVDPATQLASCIGTKELVGGLPHWLHLRHPDRDVVLYPELSYPTYEMGALLAGVRPVPVPVDDAFRLDLSAIDEADAARALCLWVNAPGNPAGGLDDLGAAAAWGREHGVLVASDECYAEFTWEGAPRSILEHGTDGVLSVHSLSKRSNLAGARAGFYAGDAELVRYLGELRLHAGYMVPGPVQAAAVAAWGDDEHVEAQRRRYHERMVRMRAILAASGIDVALPGGSFYLWAPAADGDGRGLARWLAAEAGVLASPGEFYGPAGAGHVRLAMVQPDAQLDLVADRLGVDAPAGATGP
jgi:succinyldiaminopimelate transaminase